MTRRGRGGPRPRARPRAPRPFARVLSHHPLHPSRHRKSPRRFLFARPGSLDASPARKVSFFASTRRGSGQVAPGGGGASGGDGGALPSYLPPGPPSPLAERADSVSSTGSSSATSSSFSAAVDGSRRPPHYAPHHPHRRARREDSKASVFDSVGAAALAAEAGAASAWRRAAAVHLDGLPATLAIAAVTLVAIFLDDARLAWLPRSADGVCEAIAGVVFAIFVLDLAAGTAFRPAYLPHRSLYWWVDAAATVSMALEVPHLISALSGSPPGPGGASVLARGVTDTPDARARSILRVTRILRLMRLVKLHAVWAAHREAAAFERELGLGNDEGGGAASGSPARASTAAATAAAAAATALPRPSWAAALRRRPTAWLSRGGAALAAAAVAPEAAATKGAGEEAGGGAAAPTARKPWWARPPPRSRVGQRLADLAAARVVVGVLALLLAIPGFNINSGLYGDPPPLALGGLAMLHAAYLAGGGRTPAFDAAAAGYAGAAPYPLFGRPTSRVLALAAANQTILAPPPGWESAFRPGELALIAVATPWCGGDTGARGAAHAVSPPLASAPPTLTINGTALPAPCLVSTAWLDVARNSRVAALLNLGRSAFIIAALGAGVVLMQRDAGRLVLRPMERMLRRVRAVAENPLAFSARRGGRPKLDRGVPARERLMETRILETAIAKICSLMAVGFGDAGAEVIADNMRSGGDLDPMVPGRRVCAVFGFCDIRRFTDATEVLQEDVMEFVNAIAALVHREVALHGGSPNKNIGDAFFLVWKLPEGVDEAGLAAALALAERGEGGGGGEGGGEGGGPAAGAHTTAAAAADPLSSPATPGSPELDAALTLRKVRALADGALASFITIQAALRRSRRLRELAARPAVQARLGPGFEVTMGFGLHVGWAIEGAIGSEHKVDASYLSPNVNMASRLEAATKQFGVPLLMSGAFARLLSPGVRARTRAIDVVTVKGSAVPMTLCAYDVDAARAPGAGREAVDDPFAVCDALAAAGEALPAAPAAAAAAAAGNADADTFSGRPYDAEFEEHPDLVSTWAVTPAFLARFGAGFGAYRRGEWGAARAALEASLHARGADTASGRPVVDGPSAALLAYMGAHNYAAPRNWRGFRELTDK